jgi:hypothetical protein
MAEVPAADREAAVRELLERDLDELWGATRRAELGDRTAELARAIVLVERSANDTVRTELFRPDHE